MVKFISSKNKPKITIAFTGNPMPGRKYSHKGAEDLIVDETTCHQYGTLPKLNSPQKTQETLIIAVISN